MSLFRKAAITGRQSGKRRRRRLSKARPLRCETLETRRLLIAEGAVYSFNNTFDAAGLVGDVSAVVRWGDGTTSAASSVSGGNATGNLRVRFDYSLDSGGFFSGNGQSRRDLLQIAADSLIKRFGDTLAAITPGGLNQWEPSVFHPSSGLADQLAGTLTALPKNLPVAANEIIIYAGARDLPGNNRGVGGPASFRFPTTNLTCQTQAECNQKLADIEAFRNTVRGRGQSGALASPQTDVAPQIGSVSFDNNSNWYFGIDAAGIQPGQIDFLSVATHELAHVLGFGIERTEAITSWTRLTASGVFTGPQATAAYQGNGNVPLESSHWARSVLDQVGQPTLMAPEILTGQRQLFTPLDFAAMDDLGWDLLDTRTTVTAEHRFADDGMYPVEVVLRGSIAGEVVHRVSDQSVTNVAPTLTVVGNQTVTVGQPLSIPDIGNVTDPGFANNQINPPGVESFHYSIDWGDGSEPDQGTATIDRLGNSNGAATNASFDGLHTFQTPGTRTVTVRVSDDDGGTAQRSFDVVVNPQPALSLELSRVVINEDDGENAATVTIRRSGPATGIDQTINLSSSDTSEATVAATVVIPGNATFVRVPVRAIDDALLDGDITIQIAATASSLEPGTLELLVRDRESLSATFSAAEIREGGPNSVNLIVRRSNTDTDRELVVNLAGGDSSELNVPGSVTIPVNQQQLVVAVSPIEDDDPEPPLALVYTFIASGYQGASAAIDLLDDEPPLFQNQQSPFDVNQDGEITSSDALRVINELTRRSGTNELDPARETPNGVFFDVSGDYRISARDALMIINEIARLANAASINAELTVNPIATLGGISRRDDDE